MWPGRPSGRPHQTQGSPKPASPDSHHRKGGHASRRGHAAAASPAARRQVPRAGGAPTTAGGGQRLAAGRPARNERPSAHAGALATREHRTGAEPVFDNLSFSQRRALRSGSAKKTHFLLNRKQKPVSRLMNSRDDYLNALKLANCHLSKLSNYTHSIKYYF